MTHSMRMTVLVLLPCALFAQDPPQPEQPDPAARAQRPIRIQVIGFDVDGKTEEQLKAMAAAAGGKYFPAANAGALAGALSEAIHGKPGASTATATEQEPNNRHGVANPVASTSTISGAIDPAADADWYLFETEQPGQLHVRCTGPAEQALELRVHNAGNYAHGPLMRPLRAGAETTGTIGLPRAGRWYIWVRDAGRKPSSQGYQLQLTFDPADAHEPNPKWASAVRVAPDAEIFGTILPAGDTDWFYFEAPRRGSLDIHLTDVAPELALQVRVHNAGNYAISGPLRGLSAGSEVKGTVDLPKAGRYYFYVNDVSGKKASTQSYRLKLTYHEGDEHEPNQALATATPIQATAQISGTILPKGDKDAYELAVERRGALALRLTNVPANQDLQVSVFNAGHYRIAGPFRPLRAGAEVSAVADLPGRGRYYVVVEDIKGDARSADPYCLEVRYLRGDAHEPNESRGAARRATVGQSIGGSILPRGDKDWYLIEVAEAGSYQVVVGQAPAELDVSVRVYNAEGYAVSRWITPMAVGGLAKGKLALKQPGRYYLEVVDGKSDARSTGRYSVTLQKE